MSQPEIGGPLIDAGARGIGSGFRALATLVKGASVETETAKAAAQLAKNVAQGKAVAKLGDSVAAQRVTLESSTTGQKSVVDIVTTDKAAVEVKSGDAALSSGQKAVKADIDAGRDVIPRGANAEKAGLTPGQPTKMKCYTIDRCP